MTNEEAIKCIEDVLNSDYHYDESIGYQLTSDDFEWLEKAKEGLKKQISKKPIKTRGEIVCPTCKTLVGSSSYCRYCGQAIDWSDTE